MSGPLVLSLFPGIGLLDRAFEEEGFCVVRGPDRLWGGDARRFHPPCGVFDGVIGGPPCQAHSRMVHMVRQRWGDAAIAEDLIPEFLRVVAEARPRWFVMENAKESPLPVLDSYDIESAVLNNRLFGASQNRERRISCGTADGTRILRHLDVWEAPINGEFETAVLSTSRTVAVRLDRKHRPKPRTVEAQPRTVSQMLVLQGLPPDYLDDCPFTVDGKRQAVANGVPLPMGRAIARAVKRALGQ